MVTAFYDPDSQTLWISRRFLGAGERVNKDEVFAMVDLLQGGETDDGKPVVALNYLFGSEEAAATNYQTLTFVELGVYYEDGGNRVRYEPADGPLEVDVRADFGINVPPESE